MATDYQNNDQHRRYNERLARLEERSVIALQQGKKTRRPRLKKRLLQIKQFRLRSNLRRILSIVVPFGLILLFMLYIVSPLARIKTVTVTGNHHLTARQVQAATQVRPGRFIWSTLAMKPARLTQIQHRNSQLKQVKIILTGPQSVEIAVKEYDVIGLVNAGKRPQLLLSNGKFRPVTGQVDQFVAYAGFNDHYPMLKTTAKRIGKLAPAVRNGISEVTYSPTTLDKQRLKLLMNDGNTVFVKASEIDEKMSYYPSIVANTDGNRVINLEFGAYSYEYSSKDK